MRLLRDSREAQRLVALLEPGGHTVASFVPDVYPRFARVLNPIREEWSGRVFSWREIAAPLGIRINAETQWSEIEPHLDPAFLRAVRAPDSGTLNSETASSLAGVLREFTHDPSDIIFAYWGGYSGGPENVSETIAFPPHQRGLWLAKGNLRDAAFGLPSLPYFARRPLRWWPEDRAWCVGNDIYARSVFVGGSEELIHAVFTTAVLEAYEAQADTPVTDESF